MNTAREAGFTLIEIMVVLVIIGIATAAISLSLGAAPDRALRDEGRRLALALQAAQNEVHADGRAIRWHADRDGYAFIREPGEAFAEPLLKPWRWAQGALHVSVTPSRDVRLDAEWIGQPLKLQLSDGQRQVLLVRRASGGISLQ